jgi:outer membrane protein assembly factor BamB
MGLPPVSAVAPSDPLAIQAAAIEIGRHDWPWWRGPDGNGTVSDPPIPTVWSETQNIRWKTDVPGRGHSSPIRCGSRVFLTTADEDAQTQSVLAFDFETGNRLWSTQVHQGQFPKIHPKNSHASSTPATDGSRVFAAFLHGDELIVTALDFEGRKLWQTSAGPFHSEHGYGASLVLQGPLVILSGDSRDTAYLAGLHRETGELIWRTPRSASHDHGNYSSPVLARLGGREQIIMTGLEHVISYDPLAGTELWKIDGPTLVMANTPAVQDPYVVVSGGFPEQRILSIRIDNLEDVGQKNIVWSSIKNVSYVPSPIIDKERVLILADNGTLASFQLSDGHLDWQARLGGNYTASLTRAGGDFLALNEAGEATVFRASPEFQIVHKNRLADAGGMATPSVCAGRILVRTDHALYCIEQSR